MIGNPLGWFALLALPTILAIHLFRRRFRRRPVAGLFLWTSPGQDPSAGRRLHRLERNASLFLELLAALALALYLLDLRWGEPTRLPQEIIVLDDSVSMTAEAGGSRAVDRARETVRAILARAGRNAEVSLVASGARPRLLLGPSAPAAAVEVALRDWRPAGTGHDLAPAIGLARELAGSGAAVRVVSDRMPEGDEGADSGVDWYAVGRPAANAAILAARRDRGESKRDRVFVSVGVFDPLSAETRPVPIAIVAGEDTLAAETLSIRPGAPERRVFEVDAGDRDLEVRLGADALAADDSVLLLRPPVRTLLAENRIPPDDSRHAIVARTLAALEDVRVKEGTDEAPPQLVIADAADETALAEGTWAILLGAPADAPADDGGQGFLGPFVIEKGAPVLEGLRFDRVIWRGARRGGAGWRPLVTVGEWLLVGVDPEREGRWLLNVELGAGSLVRSVDWPILVDNVARARRERLPGSSRTNLRVGESLRLVLPPDDREGWRLRGPDGESRVLRPAPALELTDLETPGIREVVRDDATLHRFAVNALDATESDLGGATTGRREAGVEAGEEAAGHLVDPRLHFPLLLAALAAFFGNWWVLERRGRRSAA